jgi:hypothetical protein
VRVAEIAVVLLALALSLSACGSKLVRLEAQGLHDEVIARASRARYAPRHAGARAFASALHAKGHSQRARDVLLKDFRRGGDLVSLVALADLELALGLDGIAAVHYTRAAALDHRSIRGHARACELLERRAFAFVEIGDGEAALDDLERVQKLCGRAPAASTIDRARRLARVQVDARVEQTRCADARCPSARTGERRAAVEKALAEPRTAVDRRRAAERFSASLGAEAVVDLVLADGRGQAGAALVDDDELRGWVGATSPESIRERVQARSSTEQAFVSMRLERVLAESDRGPTGATQRLLWIDRALVMEGAQPWRMLAYAGDLAGVELALASAWRPTSGRPPAGTGVTLGEHWVGRVEPTATSLPELLLVARLRDAAGEEDLALQAGRAVAMRAEAGSVPGATAAIAREAARAIAWGRPWTALALADAIPRAELDGVRAAAATGILLSAAVCAGPCPDDDDRGVAERVMGTPWITAIEPRLRELALSRARRLADGDGCPTLAELLATDATGPMAQALVDLRQRPDAPGIDTTLVSAIEADTALACSGRLVLPLVAARAPVLGAGRLAAMLSHGPEMRASDVLAVHAGLALVAGEGPRAEALAIAAGATATDPAKRWREVAGMARASGMRDLEMLALRELLLLQPDVDDAIARRELVAHAVRDVVRSWGAGKTPAGRESSQRIVADWVDEGVPAQRWARRESLAALVAGQGWVTDPHREAIAELILPTTERPAHRVALARLGLGARELDEAAWSPSGLAWLVERRKVATPPVVTVVFADVELLEAARLAFATHARDWGVRRRLAIGLAAYGSPAARVRAVAMLREITAEVPSARRELELLLLDAPAAIEPAAQREESPRAVGVVDDRQALARVIFGLPLEPALFLIDDETSGSARR